jgi:hypothetical protein
VPGVLDSDGKAIAKNLETTVETAAAIMGLDADSQKTTLVMLPEKELSDFRAKLELGNSLAETPSSCYAVTQPLGTNLATMRRFFGIAVALRNLKAPPWVRGALPLVLEGTRAPKASVALASIDKLGMDKFMKDPKLVAAAVHYCSIAERPDGQAALTVYVAHYPRDPEKARAELEQNMKRFGLHP